MPTANGDQSAHEPTGPFNPTRLHLALQDRGITCREFARLTGLPLDLLHRFLSRNPYPSPSLTQLLTMEAALGFAQPEVMAQQKAIATLTIEAREALLGPGPITQLTGELPKHLESEALLELALVRWFRSLPQSVRSDPAALAHRLRSEPPELAWLESDVVEVAQLPEEPQSRPAER